MCIISKELVKSEELENRIKMVCNFNNARCDFVQGKILNIDKTNVSFVEPHKINIKIKNKKIMLLYFDKDNLFFNDRSMQITLEQLNILLKELKGC